MAPKLSHCSGLACLPVTSYSLRKGNAATTRTDVVVIGVATTSKDAMEVVAGGEEVVKAHGRKWQPLLSAMGFKGKAGEVLRVPTNGTIKAPTLVVIGLGKREQLDLTAVRRAAGVAARSLGNAATAAIALPADDQDHLRAVLEGFMSGRNAPGRKSTDQAASPGDLGDVVFFSPIARTAAAGDLLTSAQVLATALDRTRAWTTQPPNELNPVTFAKAASDAAKGSGLKVSVYDEQQLADLGCGGILAVGGASATPPRLVKLEWKPKGATRHVALVGKGITYDSGGLTIKPPSSMKDMKFDMAGAASVISTMIAIAELDLPIQVTGFASMAENMVSGTSYRPGDVITMRNGRTVEVTNTDAEGRMVLADALSLAVEAEVEAIANIATLTGAAVTSLGDRYAAFFGSDDQVAAALDAAGAAGELAWPMPIPDAIRERVRTESSIADLLQHNWVRWGSSSFAAAFVQEFAEDVPFVHLDIAGPAWNSGAAWGHVPAGATGYGVATLLQWVRDHAAA